MSGDRGISGGTCQVLSLLEGDVLSFTVFVAFGESKVNDINGVFSLIVSANQKVVGFYIPMDDSFLMNDLDSLDHLDCNVEASLQVKLSSALLELVFETLTEEVHYHDMEHLTIFSLLITNEMEVWHGCLSSELVDEFGLPEEHNVLGVLNCLLNLGCEEVASLFFLHLVDISEGSTAQLLDNLVSLVENLLALVHAKI